MHEAYQLAYCPKAHITSLAFANGAFESARLTPEFLRKVRGTYPTACLTSDLKRACRTYSSSEELSRYYCEGEGLWVSSDDSNRPWDEKGTLPYTPAWPRPTPNVQERRRRKELVVLPELGCLATYIGCPPVYAGGSIHPATLSPSPRNYCE
jgi:hypothetical protein